MCCSCFLVSRDRVRIRPKVFYEMLFNYSYVVS